MKKRHKIIRKITAVLIISIVVLAGCAGIYISDYYHADPAAMAIANGQKQVTTANGTAVDVFYEDDTLVFMPDDPKYGLVFYPGGKVQYEAYAVLMSQLASEGIMCVIPHLTGNIGLLEKMAAEPVLDKYSEIDEWYIGGHSLGGIAASMYAKKNPARIEGVIFLASYPYEDLSESGLRMLSIYGDCDEVLLMDSYTESMGKFASDYEEIVIEGGCHAYYGNYGDQKGDGTPSISREEQQQITGDAIADFIKNAK